MPSVRKLTLIFFLLLTSLFTLPSSIEAQWKSPEPKEWDAKKNTNFSINNSIEGLYCIWFPNKKGCVATDINGKTLVYTGEERNFASSGPLIGIATLSSMTYQAPVSSVQYLANLGENFGVIKPAYAQTTDVPGSGAGIIQPVIKIWQLSRNIAYLFFIAIFLVVGFMIMFRRKLNPQTVITAQAALPGLVVGLLMVTFSYFVAALMIDLAFVGTKLIGYLFSEPIMQLKNQFGSPVDLANSSSVFNLFGSAFAETVPSMGSFISGTYNLQASMPYGLGFIIPIVVGAVAGMIAGPFGLLFGGLAGAGAAAALPLIIPTLITLILMIALFVQLFRLFFGLIFTYIQILVFTVGGPFVILFAAIPGRGGAIGGWIKALVANALVFPAVFAAFMFAGALLANSNANDWKVAPPLFGGVQVELLRVLLAYGIVLGTPAIPEMIRNLFGVKGLPGGIDKAALGGFVAGAGVARGAAGRGWKFGTQGLDRQREAYQTALAKYRAGDPTIATDPSTAWGAATGRPAGRWGRRLADWWVRRGT